ncbi:MAG: ATP-binding protein [Bacteroidota bacterium]
MPHTNITDREKLLKLIEASKILNSSLNLDELLNIIVDTAVNLIDCERGTLFLIDELAGEIWSKTIRGGEMIEIRLKLGVGISGTVAKSGETILIDDAYSDSRFNQEIDKQSGYKTKTILTLPLKNKNDKTIGVFQLLNKRNNFFLQDDVEMLNALSVHAAIAIENTQIIQSMLQKERLSAIGQMAGTIIHDIKNPMGTLRVYAQSIKKKVTDSETIQLADEIIHQVDRFVNMTQEILDYSRGVSATNFEIISLNDVLDAALIFINKDLQKRNIKLNRELNYFGNVKIDTEKLGRVFFNIAGNAADAMPNGGSLTVSSNKINNRIEICFADSGIGMPEEVQKRIFEPFVTFGKKHGTGLGMAIVKNIVDSHGGGIEIQSEQNVGTKIIIYLPLTD